MAGHAPRRATDPYNRNVLLCSLFGLRGLSAFSRARVALSDLFHKAFFYVKGIFQGDTAFGGLPRYIKEASDRNER